MLLIGSMALRNQGFEIGRPAGDVDYICTFDQFQRWTRDNKEIIKRCVPLSDTKFHVLSHSGMNYEFEIAWEGTAARQLLDMYEGHGEASVDWCYALKMSHRYLKDSVHFLKTMRDIQFLRTVISDDAQLIIDSEWFKQRERETYTYNHPKLDVSKDQFFTGDGVQYVYDHDELHKIVAVEAAPAYTKYMKEGEQVMTSKEKFFAVDQRIRLLGGLEESMVLALERSQVPHGLGKEGGPTDRWSFEMALMKVCTSITSGYFREFCWENHSEIMHIYNEMGESWYTDKFKEAVQNGEIVPRDL